MGASRRAKLRDLLNRPELIRALAVHDAFAARIAERAGVPLLFLGGFGVAASRLGLPDLGLLTAPEMIEAARAIAARVAVPLIVDIDTGFGGVLNVARTVRELEAAGVAGVLIEDQVFPKRCGHFAGKRVVPVPEMLDRLHAALRSRRHDDFIVIARTDARAVEGLDAALERALHYREAGADVCFVEAPRSLEELRLIPQTVPGPHLANMLTGGQTPIVSCD
ncbi:MAG: carboxyvinyl-carboxyphosphonate phosphorylmutase, partial [Planctomycetota bacterium]